MNNSRLSKILISVAVLMAVTLACASGADAVPTVDVGSIQTAAVSSAIAKAMTANAPTATPLATATPVPTRTPRPTATPELGTLDNPYPYGAAANLYITSQGQRSDFTVQVLNLIRGDDANYLVSSANMFNDAPPAGASWMFVQLRVTLDSGAALKLTDYDLAVITGGQIFDGFSLSVCCTEELGYPGLDANIAVPGTSVEGWIIRPFVLNDNKTVLALGLNTYQTDLKDGIYLSLQP